MAKKQKTATSNPKMRILVIDDSPWNIESAKITLVEYDLTTANSIDEACQKLNDEEFDAVLTDCFIEIGSFNGAFMGGGVNERRLPEDLIPAGLVFAIKAANKGIRAVLCSDANHHDNHIASLMDLLVGHYGKHAGEGGGRDFYTIEGRDSDVKIAYVQRAYMNGYWDREAGKIVEGKIPDEFYRPENRHKRPPVPKDWKKAMAESDLFPELPKPARQPEEIRPLSDEEIPPRIGKKPGGKGGQILPRM